MAIMVARLPVEATSSQTDSDMECMLASDASSMLVSAMVSVSDRSSSPDSYGAWLEPIQELEKSTSSAGNAGSSDGGSSSSPSAIAAERELVVVMVYNGGQDAFGRADIAGEALGRALAQLTSHSPDQDADAEATQSGDNSAIDGG